MKTAIVLVALLALVLPAAAFKAIVPAFILIALALIVAQPRLSRALEHHRPRAHPRPGWVATAAVLASGIYGGYFGAAQGILLLAILGLAVNGAVQQTVTVAVAPGA